MDEFKAGEEVEAVDSYEDALTQGKHYVVLKVQDGIMGVLCDDGEEHQLFTSRFRRLAPAPATTAYPLNHCQCCGHKRQDFGVVCGACFAARGKDERKGESDWSVFALVK